MCTKTGDWLIYRGILLLRGVYLLLLWILHIIGSIEQLMVRLIITYFCLDESIAMECYSKQCVKELS